MKKGLLGSTALFGATALMAGVAGAAEAPTWKLTGNMNFQAYYVNQDNQGINKTAKTITGPGGTISGTFAQWDPAAKGQDHGWYFGVDESELQLNVSGTADNGLNYGFKIEINANTTDTKVADEARLQFSGGWGTLQMGDEDGAEDIMNYGGENLMGATGGFDGDQNDYLYQAGTGTVTGGLKVNLAATSFPTIAGDTSDSTKVSYFSPRISGFQVGGSITPNPSLNGDNFKEDGKFQDSYGLGANYDNSFGGVRVRASAVYSAASSNTAALNDISAWSVGTIVGFGPVSVGANYTDNGDSGEPTGFDWKSSYWDVAAGFETGPLYLSVGYFDSTKQLSGGLEDSTYKHVALTADYTVAPGLGVYAEVNRIKDDIAGGNNPQTSNGTTSVVVGANVSF
jgi:hypothetical protein